MSSPATGPLATYPGMSSPSTGMSSSSPAPSPTPVNPWWNPTGLPIWALTLIFVIILILIVGGFGYMMTRNKPLNLQ